MKWTMRYIAGTTKVGLVYIRLNTKLLIEGHNDGDYADDRDNRRSTTTYYFIIGGCCISCKVQLQPVVALSTTESEYIIVTEAIKEALWLQGLLEEVTKVKQVPIVYSDSQSFVHEFVRCRHWRIDLKETRARTLKEVQADTNQLI
ncbi:secreted RxLR effector protein 161-like [Cannabis sativa]|uniref:secreted RxLR effector protein 161-like n=1 Tax=Cannabis sativa TaxID=3483 RepID=UPI0029C9EF76|nr:secreted RxLR effector protein 161-like [Cannabis sativa]